MHFLKVHFLRVQVDFFIIIKLQSYSRPKIVSHISLLVVIISVKNSCSCSNGLAKYKLIKELTQTIRFKYFFPADQPLQTFANRDLVFILGKFIVENSEPCFTITYSSIVDNENSNRKFDLSNIPVTIPHSIYFVTVIRQLKNVRDFIHFSAETIQYNSVTSNSDIKIDMTIIYSLNSSKFKYLDHLGTNIDYLRTSSNNISGSESSHSTISDILSIIDIIDDDIDSTVMKASQDQYGSFRKSVNSVNANVEATTFYNNKEYHTTNANIEAGLSHNNKKYNTTIEDYQTCDEKFQDIEELEESQPRKRKRATRKATKGKGKQY
ncbi:9113_t:CDS:2 [Scutellospora calospora]|uniref:9113_t:CDS:1 n=1 Tax=Scutellospora calospora TaxID=85575 RepID=A0ACA9LML7_9GLOM|nr:9113_t:CDS:2 [Scutellospora calospora]